jgi:putative nucleotidyltransferase with HDIG domain
LDVAGPCYVYVTMHKGERVAAVSMACHVRPDQTALRLDPAEASGSRWVTVEEWLALATEGLTPWSATDIMRATTMARTLLALEAQRRGLDGGCGMDRDEALELIREKVPNENLVKHMLATEAIMGALAERLGGDRGRWALTGLLHDLDVVETADAMEVHGTRTVEWLREAGMTDEDILDAIAAHNPANGSTIDSTMAGALFAADPLTGLITAAALIRPEKKLASVELKSLKKRFKEPSFARGARREDILTCEELGIPLEEFMAIGLAAMKGVADDIGL